MGQIQTEKKDQTARKEIVDVALDDLQTKEDNQVKKSSFRILFPSIGEQKEKKPPRSIYMESVILQKILRNGLYRNLCLAN